MVEKMQMFKIFLVMSVKIYYAVVKNYHTPRVPRGTCLSPLRSKPVGTVVKIGNDNTPKDPLKKHNYTKVIIEDPYNNRDIIARVALNPYFVSGFSDGESCFVIRVRKNPNCKIGWDVQA
jgi:hypothetical protein